MTILQAALTGSNTSTPLLLSSPSMVWIEINGTFGGGSVALHEGGAAMIADGTGISWTAKNRVLLDLPSGSYTFVAAGVTTVSIAYEMKPL